MVFGQRVSSRVGRGRLRAAVVALVTAATFAAAVPAADAYRDGDFAYGWMAVKQCKATGGAHDLGYMGANVWMQEFGKSGTKNFKIEWRRQYLGTDGRWRDDRWAHRSSANFPNDSANYHWGFHRRLWPNGAHVEHIFPFTATDYGTYRLKVIWHFRGTRLGVWHDKYKKALFFESCTPSDRWDGTSLG